MFACVSSGSCFQSCIRQTSRPWGSCQAGWRGLSTRSAPDMAAHEAAGVVSFPPLQTYSEEENMMRETGELEEWRGNTCPAAAADSWRQKVLKTRNICLLFLSWQWKNMHKSASLQLCQRWMKTLSWMRKWSNLSLNRAYVIHFTVFYQRCHYIWVTAFL